MQFQEEKRDLFSVDDSYYLAHCISADYKMSAGIAKIFEQEFNLKKSFKKIPPNALKVPNCILIGRIFNLITKEKYWHKPTYETLAGALQKMKKLTIEKNITKIAMPRIGCGLDKLRWERVREIIREVFRDNEVEILVCYL